MTQKKIRVLVVDDSAFARKVVREILSTSPEIEVVGIARDGLEALEKMSELNPDVITLDLVMPDLDGIGFLKSLPKGTTARVVVVSVSGSDSELALEALDLGVVDLVTKPTTLPTDRLYELSTELIEKVKAASIARTRRHPDQMLSPISGSSIIPMDTEYAGRAELVLIGTSTGGPQAISDFFSRLPARFPVPIAIALHIPAGYTEPLAARISKTSQVLIREAYHGQELVAGEAVIAPGGMHLKIRKTQGKFFAMVSREPLDSVYHPSVDLLFASAAEQAGRGVVGIVLTGMGSDGLLGSKAIRSSGGWVIAESASSCVVYGMPRSVIEAGMANREAPLAEIPTLLLDYLYRPMD